MTSHAIYPPSAAERWLACPASVRYTVQYGLRSVSSAAAELGVQAHRLAQQCLEHGLDVRDVLTVPVPDLLQVQLYLDEIRATLAEHAHEQPRLAVEQRVYVDAECWGTLDAAIITSTAAYVFDLKHGRHPVAAVGNPQLLTYALALSHLAGVPRYELVIVQPRVTSGLPVKRWVARRRDLTRHARHIANAKRQMPVAAPSPGEHCRYCPARTVCPATQND